jgi:hypothetical protein
MKFLNKSIILLFIILLLSNTSCKVTKEQVGNYSTTDCKPKLFREGKDIYLFWEMVPLRRTEKKINLNNYEKEVSRDFFDTVIFYGTAGIFSFYSVKINIKDCSENPDAYKKNR